MEKSSARLLSDAWRVGDLTLFKALKWAVLELTGTLPQKKVSEMHGLHF